LEVLFLTSIEKAENLHRRVNTFFLSCVDSEGYPLTKAVVPGKYRESLKEMYFCTNTSSKFAGAINNNPKSSVYFYSRKLFWFKGCFLKGEMVIVADIKIKEKYWQSLYKNAYPQKSFTDPDFCLLRFTPATGRLYADFSISDFEF
jgi:general stress protein 26